MAKHGRFIFGYDSESIIRKILIAYILKILNEDQSETKELRQRKK